MVWVLGYVPTSVADHGEQEELSNARIKQKPGLFMLFLSLSTNYLGNKGEEKAVFLSRRLRPTQAGGFHSLITYRHIRRVIRRPTVLSISFFNEPDESYALPYP